VTGGFLPYGRQDIDDDDVAAVVETLRSDFLTTGPTLARFEAAVAERVGASWAVAVSSGTAALHASCHAARLGPGDEVVVPAISFVASANCARYVGAEPVFADVDPNSGLISSVDVERQLSDTTSAIVAVHLTGAPAATVELAAMVAGREVTIIEDAAHAIGATSHGGAVGGCVSSAMAVFSFHPVKTVTSAEGGVVTGNDPELARRLRSFRNHGIVKEPTEEPWYYEQRELGFNYRLSDVHAALGLSQLAKLDGFLDKRRALAGRYRELLESVDHVTPVTTSEVMNHSGHHLFSVLIEFEQLGADRAQVMNLLRQNGIGSQVHYIPIPAQPYYRERGWRVEDFPGALSYYQRTLSLPLYPTMTSADVDRVVSALVDAIAGSAGRRS